MSQGQAGWTLEHPPSGEFRWAHDSQIWVSTGDELWRVSEPFGVWPTVDVDALVADGADVLVRSRGVRQRLGCEPRPGRFREGLHRTAVWTLRGWQITDLALPYGARWSSSLMPTATGYSAVWTTDGQHFECSALGVRAVRERDERWWPRTDHLPQTWAVAHSGSYLWGPGGKLWNLASGESQSLPGWMGGVAAAKGKGAVVVNAMTGDGVVYEESRAVRTFSVPLRRDVAATLTWDERGPVLTTELGKQFALSDGDVTKLPGRVVPPAADGVELAELGIRVDGRARVSDTEWAWRHDGLLLRRL